MIHCAQFEGKTAVGLSVNTHGRPIVYVGRCGKAVTVLVYNIATTLVLLVMIEERLIFKMQQS